VGRLIMAVARTMLLRLQADGSKDTDGWQTFQNTQGGWWHIQKPSMATSTSYSVKFCVQGLGVNLWVDRLTLYDQADINKTNLLVNPTLMKGIGAGCEDVTKVVATGGSEQISLSWTNPNDPTFLRARIYNADTGTKLADAGQGASSTVVTGLVNGTTYNLKIVSVNAEGTESIGVNASVTPLPPDIQFAGPEFSTNVLVSGEVTVTAGVKNNSKDNGINACLVLVLYRGSEMYDIIGVSASVPKTPYYADNTRLTSKITVPSDTATYNYTLKAFLWDGVTTMMPYKAAKVIGE